MNKCKRGCCNVNGRFGGGALGVSRASLSADQSVPLAPLSSRTVSSNSTLSANVAFNMLNYKAFLLA
jgi:hypothetical protein